MKLRVASYNVFNGGAGRMEEISRVLTVLDPDVCGILEAVGWEKNRQDLKNFFQAIGFKYLYIAPSNTRHNIAVLSKRKLNFSHKKNFFWHVAVKIFLEDKNKVPLNFIFLHLNPFSEDKRLLEINQLEKIIDNYSFILGDLNSLSKHDPYDKKKLVEKLREADISKFGKEQLLFDVTSNIESLGFKDALYLCDGVFHVSTPTLYNTDPNHQFGLRIDYVFAREGVTNLVKNSGIFRSDPVVEKASDHYPVFVDIELPD